MIDLKNLFWFILLALGIFISCRGFDIYCRDWIQSDVCIGIGGFCFIISLAHYYLLMPKSYHSIKLSFEDWCLIGFCFLLIPVFDLVDARPTPVFDWFVLILFPVILYKVVRSRKLWRKMEK